MLKNDPDIKSDVQLNPKIINWENWHNRNKMTTLNEKNISELLYIAVLGSLGRIKVTTLTAWVSEGQEG